MSKTFRCPVDDVIFETVNNHRAPHHHYGHPECPGPKCRKGFEIKQTSAQQAAIAAASARKAAEMAADALKIANANAEAAAKRATEVAASKDGNDIGASEATAGEVSNDNPFTQATESKPGQPITPATAAFPGDPPAPVPVQM